MPTGAEIVAATQKHLGKKYVYGSAGPRTFDCSGLVTYVYKQFGISLPHHAADQAKRGVAVSKGDIQPGDLVFSNWGSGPNSHVGIAVSGNRIINAPATGRNVEYRDLSAGYLSHVTAIRRMKGVTQGGATTRPATVGGTTPTTGGGGDRTDPDVGGAIDAVGAAGAGGVKGSITGTDTGPFAAISNAIRTALLPLTSLQTFSDQIMRFFLPTGIVRFVCGVAGAIFIAWGAILLAREVRD